MRILQIYELGPLDGENVTNGIDISILELSKNLVKLGHEVSVLCGAGNGVSERHCTDGVEIIPVDFLNLMHRTWSPYNLRFLRQTVFPLVALKNRYDYDIYHGHVYTSGLLANYLARRKSAKAVNTIHGSYYPIWGEIEGFFTARFYKNSERLLAPLLAKISDLQIHTASYFAQKVVEWGAPIEKIRVIYNGYSPEIFHPHSEFGDFGYHHPPILFTARRLVRKNGVEYLLKAFEKILRERESTLIIAGDGPEKQKLERLSSSMSISDHVIFLGVLPHHDISVYLSIADVVVLPSLIEASSLFALEAIAMEKPLVATRVGGLPEIADGALFVNPRDVDALADGISQALDNGSGHKNKVEKHTWGEVARQTEKAYYSLF